jgi:hypothetical protein
MPTYQNNSSSPIYQNDQNHTSYRVPAGATFQTNYYIANPTENNLIKTSDEPLVQPFQLLATISSAPSAPVDVSGWDTAVIFNASTGPITVAANGDSTNAMIIPAGAKEEWDDTLSLIGTLTVITNAGTGNIYIWGKTTISSVYYNTMLKDIVNIV